MNHMPCKKTRSGKIDGKSNPIDVHVGSRVRLRRTLLGMSQEKLGEAIGLTFQQVQKYERGSNRIGASRLHDLTRVLGVPVSFFFDDMPPEVDNASPVHVHSGSVISFPSPTQNPLNQRDVLEPCRNYLQLPPGMAQHIRQLVASMVPASAAEA